MSLHRRRRAGRTSLAALLGLGLLVAPQVALAQPAAPRPPAAAPGVLTKPPKLVTFVEAAYPPEEKAAGKTASVVLRLAIDTQGRVEEVAVQESAGPAFDAAASSAARQFLFEPAEVDGQTARVRILYRYEFTLQAEVPTTAIFSGIVRDRTTKTPIAGARVAIEGSGEGGTDAGAREVVTDDAGRFQLDAVAPGTRRVTIAAPGQTPVQTDESFEPGRRLEASYEVDQASPDAAEGGEPAEDLELVVTAPPLSKNVTSVEVGQDEGRRVPGTQGDVLKVVQNLPGVGRAAAGSGALVVWGAAPEDTRVYVDGVRVPLLYHFGGVRSVIQSDLVRAVDLTPGAYGAPHGRGLGGLVTVSLIPLDDPDHHGSTSVDFLDAAASLRSGLGESLRAAVGVRYGWAHRVVPVVSDEDVGELFPVPRYLDGQARVAWFFSPRASLEIGALGSLDEVERTVDSEDPASRRGDARSLTWGRVYGRYASQRDDGTEVSLTPWYGRDDRSERQRFGAVTTEVASESEVFGLRGSWRGRLAPEREAPFAGAVATVGLDTEITRATVARSGSLGVPAREGDARVFGQRPSEQVASDTWDAWTGSPAVFGELDVSLFSGAVHVVPGARVEPYVISASRQSPVVGETPSIGLFSQELFVEPRLAVRVRPWEPLELRAAYGLYHQPPAAEDLSAVFGRPTLESPSSQHVLGGANLAPGGGFSIDLVGFATFSEDLAVRSALEQPLLARALASTGVGRAFGGQVLLRREREGGFFGWISYGLTRSERASSPEAEFRPFDFDQTHVLTALASYEIGLGFEIGSRFRLASGFPRTAVESAYYDARTDTYQPRFGPTNGTRLPTFVQLDARLSKRFDVGRVELEAYLDVQNVTNHENVEEIVHSESYAETGAITGVPILPVLGVRSSW